MALFADAAKSAKTVVWNGPMGVFENPDIDRRVQLLSAKALAEADATTIIGGGDSATAAINLGLC